MSKPQDNQEMLVKPNVIITALGKALDELTGILHRVNNSTDILDRGLKDITGQDTQLNVVDDTQSELGGYIGSLENTITKLNNATRRNQAAAENLFGDDA